ncbi:MAG: hypothetical protein R3B52_00075 [Candidatus Paceibacterota bacterium]
MPKLHSHQAVSEKVLLGEVQLLLAEKRTYFSLLRTGIAIFTFPLTVLAFLAATTQYHQIFERIFIGLPLTITLLLISVIGLMLFFNAEAKLKRLNMLLKDTISKNRRVSQMVV